MEAPLSSGEFVKSFHDALVYSMFRTLLGKAWSLLPQARYIKTCATAHNFIDYYVEKALHEQTQSSTVSGKESTITPRKRSLMSGLSSQTRDRDYIRYQIVQAMMAAQDTTSELLTNTLFLLARHPDYWQRLRVEVAQMGDNVAEAEVLTASKLIEHIILESG